MSASMEIIANKLLHRYSCGLPTSRVRRANRICGAKDRCIQRFGVKLPYEYVRPLALRTRRLAGRRHKTCRSNPKP